MRVNGFEFVPLQPILTGYDESRLIRFLSTGQLFGQEPLNYLACKNDGNKYVKLCLYWNQLLAMMFGQLSNRESLRNVVVALDAHHSKCIFLGIGSKPITKTTLASANQKL